MDARKTALVEQFLEQKSVEEWFSGEVLRYLPTPPLLPPNLKKSLFLRRLSSDLSLSLLSLDTLDLLELLEEADRSLAVASPPTALSSAYCALAVELTVAPLRRLGGEAAFLEAVHWIWECRLADLEKSGARELVDQGLREWRAAIMEAVGSTKARDALLKRDTRREAEEAVKEYLRVAVSGMYGPMIDLLAKAAGYEDVPGETGEDGAVRGEEGNDQSHGKKVPASEIPVTFSETSKPTAAPPGRVGQAGVGSLATTVEGRLHVPEPETNGRDVLAGRIGDNMTDALSKKLPLLSSIDVNKVRKALKSSCEELQKVVLDPLPDALKRASAVQLRIVEGLEGSVNINDANENQKQIVTSELEASVQDNVGEAICQSHLSEHNTGVSSPTELQNKLCNTIDGGEESSYCPTPKSTNGLKRTRFQTMNRENLPLPSEEVTKFVRRRKLKRWSPQEEDALREAVKKLGKGNWKFILQSYPEAFQDRTEIDLKDKWRNMTR